MDKTKTVELTGKAGNWVALKGNSYEVVAEGRTLKEVAAKAQRLGVKNPTFARIPRKDCALILQSGLCQRCGSATSEYRQLRPKRSRTSPTTIAR